MASLQHDSQGFLIGEVIADIRRTNTLLTSIASDIATIKQAMVNAGDASGPDRATGPSPNGRSARSGSSGASGTAEPRRRRRRAAGGSGASANGGALSNSQSDTAPINTDARLAPANGESAEPRQRRRTAAQRDRNGRFTSNNEGEQRRQEQTQRRLFDGLGDRLTGAITGSATGLETIDPTIKAFNEVAQPLARGYQLFAGGDKETRWYRRIFKELNLFRKDQTTFNRAEQRTLNEISENTENQGRSVSGGGSGIGGGILSTLTTLLGLRAGSVIADGAGRMLSGIGGGLLRGGRGLLRGGRGALRFGGKLLRRIPLVGGLLGGLGAASDVYDNETDDTLTRQEKSLQNGKAVGGAAGSIGGMMAGAAAGSLLGPVGTVVGGVVGAFLGDQAGQIIGEKLGEWTNSLIEYDLPGKIMETWNHLTDSFRVGWEDIKKRWDEFFNKALEGWDQLTGFFKSAYDALKKLPVIGPAIEKAETLAKKAYESGKETVQRAVEKTKALPGKAGEAVKQGADWAEKNTTIGKGLSKAIEPTTKALKSAKEWVIGQTSKFFESGKGGAGTVSSGKGDYGGASYGTYQLSSKQGTLQKFLKSSGYGEQFEGLTPGTKAFNQRWKEIAKSDSAFGSAQHDFIKKTHFDVQAERLKQSGIDISDRGKAVKDAVWSTSVQFGGNTDLITKALKHKDTAKMSDVDFVSALQEYKIANNDRLFSRSSNQVRTGTLNRAMNEKTQLLTLAALEGRMAALPQTPTQTVSAPSPSVPSIPKSQPIAEAPQVMMPLGSGSRKPLSISIDKGDVGQDISDRRLAHIVTGGLSS